LTAQQSNNQIAPLFFEHNERKTVVEKIDDHFGPTCRSESNLTRTIRNAFELNAENCSYRPASMHRPGGMVKSFPRSWWGVRILWS
jgi:hypothetical protein